MFSYPVLSYEVYDADTVKVSLDRGWGETKRLSCRISGIDSPELRTRNLLEKETGYLVKAVTQTWLAEREASGQPIMMISMEKGKYFGRCVGDLYPLGDPEDTLSRFLLELGVVDPYAGGKKAGWTDERLNQIKVVCETIALNPEMRKVKAQSSLEPQ